MYGARQAVRRRGRRSTASGSGAGSVTAAVKAGVGLAPEERKSQGLLLDEAVYRNITVSSLSRFSRAGFLDAVGRARGGRAS